MMGRIGARFARVEPRRRATAFVSGLLSGLTRTNCWTIAERVGHVTPDGMQHLLARAVWDTDGVRDDLREYVIEQLGDPDAVLVIDETGDVKKGTTTVGVQRQYTGTAGRIENAQVAVYVVYAAGSGYAFVDRALYLPKSWTDDPKRCAAAGIPDDVQFATKPTLAGQMIARVLAAGAPAKWVAGDEVYGADPKLRKELRRNQIGYVLAVAKNHQVLTKDGSRRADDLAARLPKRSWQRLSAGHGAKGERWYDWALISTSDPTSDPEPATTAAGDNPAVQAPTPPTATPDGCHWLLIRRNRATGELAYYRAFSPTRVRLAVLVRVAGTRWRIEESFQSGKELAALDEHQVRRWISWHRWTVLAMLVHAFLSVMTAKQPPPEPDTDLIPLTRNEIRHLYVAMLIPPALDRMYLLHWSHWRRRHQYRSQTSHYRRRAAETQDHDLRL